MGRRPALGPCRMIFIEAIGHPDVDRYPSEHVSGACVTALAGDPRKPDCPGRPIPLVLHQARIGAWQRGHRMVDADRRVTPRLPSARHVNRTRSEVIGSDDRRGPIQASSDC